MNVTGWNNKPVYAAAFRTGVTAPGGMLSIDPACLRICTWVPRGPWKPMAMPYALKYEYLLCRYYGRHAEAVR